MIKAFYRHAGCSEWCNSLRRRGREWSSQFTADWVWLGPSKSVFPEPFLSHSWHLKRQISKSSRVYEPQLKPQTMVWLGLAHPIWQTVTKLNQAELSQTVAALSGTLFWHQLCFQLSNFLLVTMQGLANQMEWVSVRFDKIHFYSLVCVELASIGFILIRINKILLYNFWIERYQMPLIFLTRFDMICSIVWWDLIWFDNI